MAEKKSESTLRVLTGADELTLRNPEPLAAIALLGRLGNGLDVAALDVATADRLLAELYRRLYGDRCDCRVHCGACGDTYDFELSLGEVMAHQDALLPTQVDDDGGWTLGDGTRVRAPRVGEVGLPPDELLSRLVLQGSSDAEQVLAFLERAAPILSLEVKAACPYCGSDQEVRFDLARYLVQRLLDERPLLLREVHLIAGRYGWSLSDVLALSRDDRRAFAGLIETERTAPRRWRAP
jgi:hypothetical protein